MAAIAWHNDASVARRRRGGAAASTRRRNSILCINEGGENASAWRGGQAA